MRPDQWPHTFAPQGRGWVLDNGTHAIPYKCTHCGLEYIQGEQSRPEGACPKRNDTDEHRRLLRK